MAYVPVEEVTKVVKNKYEAVVVAAREARKINSAMRMVGREETKEKVTSRSLRRVGRGDVDFVYLEEPAPVPEAFEVPDNDQPNPI